MQRRAPCEYVAICVYSCGADSNAYAYTHATVLVAAVAASRQSQPPGALGVRAQSLAVDRQRTAASVRIGWTRKAGRPVQWEARCSRTTAVVSVVSRAISPRSLRSAPLCSAQLIAFYVSTVVTLCTDRTASTDRIAFYVSIVVTHGSHCKYGIAQLVSSVVTLCTSSDCVRTVTNLRKRNY